MERLILAMNGTEVAVLTRESSGVLSFQYQSRWLEQPGARAVSLSLPLGTKRYTGPKVFNFFDNLLPDSDTLRTRMQARFRTPTKHPFDLLSSIGRDCIGAIQLYPENTEIQSVRDISAQPISETEIAQLLSGYQDAPLGMARDTDFRLSLAGAQEKTALLWHQGNWQLPTGPTPTSHIFKLPIGYLDHSNIDLRESSENEWLCLQILKAYGLPSANAWLHTFGEQNVLIVERFDRRWSADKTWLMRLPQEDFCQAMGIAPALKYESDGGPGIRECMDLLMGSQHANDDRDRFFKTQILFWVLAAIDGHAKNFSLFLEPETAYRMAPLYDVISAHPLMAQGSLTGKRTKMAMSLKGKNRHYHWQRIEPRHFITTAKLVGFSPEQVKSIMADIVESTEEAITKATELLPKAFPEKVYEPIILGIRNKVRELENYLQNEIRGPLDNRHPGHQPAN